MRRPRGPNPKLTALQVENWNLKHAVGIAVHLQKDNGDVILTKTRSEALIAALGHAVIFLEGIAGYYLLERVEAR